MPSAVSLAFYDTFLVFFFFCVSWYPFLKPDPFWERHPPSRVISIFV